MEINEKHLDAAIYAIQNTLLCPSTEICVFAQAIMQHFRVERATCGITTFRVGGVQYEVNQKHWEDLYKLTLAFDNRSLDEVRSMLPLKISYNIAGKQ